MKKAGVGYYSTIVLLVALVAVVVVVKERARIPIDESSFSHQITDTTTGFVPATPQPMCRFVTAWGSQGTGNGQFGITSSGQGSHGPFGISLDMQGNVYVVDSGNYRIQQFNPMGRFIRSFNISIWRGEDPPPKRVVVDSQGQMYIAALNQIVKVSPVSSQVALIRGNFFEIVDLERDTQNNRLYVLSQGSTPDDRNMLTNIEDDLPQESIHLNFRPGGITVANSGEQYLTIFAGDDDSSGDIVKLDSDGEIRSQLDLPAGTYLGDIEVADYLFLVDTLQSKIVILDRSGNKLTEIGSLGQGDGQFAVRSPSQIAVNDNDEIYAIDTNNFRVQKFSCNLPTPVPECVDSDNGVSPFQRGVMNVSYPNWQEDSYADRCISGRELLEYYCDAQFRYNPNQSRIIDCSQYESGICSRDNCAINATVILTPLPVQLYTPVSEEQETSCTDGDGDNLGAHYIASYVTSTSGGTTERYTDECITKDYLWEYRCIDGRWWNDCFQCKECDAGKCVYSGVLEQNRVCEREEELRGGQV